MLGDIVAGRDVRFRRHADVSARLLEASAGRGSVRTAEVIGRSEAGRDLVGFVLGSGPHRVSLIAGNHSDEPVGPETLGTLVEWLSTAEEADSVLRAFTFVVVPHTNPDGDDRNRPWIEQWPDPGPYLEHAFRELPGRDMEFSFPDGRVESRAVSDFLSKYGPYRMHCSLHGMGFSDGAFLLIDRSWGFRTEALQERFRTLAAEAGLALHDHNRKGEKGFFYLGPGFNTTPEGEAMRTYFRARRDEAMASRFRMSSMEFAKSLGGDPLCLVTELPLFLIASAMPSEPGRPETYLTFLEQLREVRGSGDEAGRRRLLSEFDVQPLDLRTAMRLQLETIEAGLEAVAWRPAASN